MGGMSEKCVCVYVCGCMCMHVCVRMLHSDAISYSLYFGDKRRLDIGELCHDEQFWLSSAPSPSSSSLLLLCPFSSLFLFSCAQVHKFTLPQLHQLLKSTNFAVSGSLDTTGSPDGEGSAFYGVSMIGPSKTHR